MEIIPLWTSHYTLGKSILTLEKYKSSSETEPDSIIDLCVNNNIQKVFLVEDNLTGFLEAYTNCKSANLDLRFGYKVNICSDINKKDEDSLETESKYIIFAKNYSGYKRLVNISSTANEKGFYYKPRIDFQILHSNWSDEDLLLCIPFYDSFLFNNCFLGKLCIPDFKNIKPVFFLQNNYLPFDFQMRKRVLEYASKYPILESKSIYYKCRNDYLAYLTFRCMKERTTVTKPNLENFSSQEFCLESYLESKKL